MQTGTGDRGVRLPPTTMDTGTGVAGVSGLHHANWDRVGGGILLNSRGTSLLIAHGFNHAQWIQPCAVDSSTLVSLTDYFIYYLYFLKCTFFFYTATTTPQARHISITSSKVQKGILFLIVNIMDPRVTL